MHFLDGSSQTGQLVLRWSFKLIQVRSREEKSVQCKGGSPPKNYALAKMKQSGFARQGNITLMAFGLWQSQKYPFLSCANWRCKTRGTSLCGRIGACACAGACTCAISTPVWLCIGLPRLSMSSVTTCLFTKNQWISLKTRRFNFFIPTQHWNI